MGFALMKLRALLGLDVEMEVLEVELAPVARTVAQKMGG